MNSLEKHGAENSGEWGWSEGSPLPCFLHRLQLALVLTPAFFLLTIWQLALSTVLSEGRAGVVAMLAWALLTAFGCAYAVILFLDAWQGDGARKR